MPFLIVLGVATIIFGLGCIISTIKLKRAGQGISNWPIVGGIVKHSFVYPHARRTLEHAEETHTPVSIYEYVVDGKSYKSSKRAPVPYLENTVDLSEKADAMLANLPDGTVVRVRYNPHAPDQSVLHVSRPIAHNAVGWFGFTNIVMGVLSIVLALILS